MNLHDELGRHGADATAESRSRLGSVEVRETLGSRVRRGRRRRAAGGVGAVAAVALVAVGVWSVLPGTMRDAEPAGTIDANLEIRGTTYEVDDTAPVDPEIPIDLRLVDGLECGAVVELDEGVTVHDSSVTDDGVRVAALSVSSVMSEDVTEQWLWSLDEGERDDSWDNLVAENPTEVDVSESGQQAFESQVVVDGDANITHTTIPLLLRDGEIVSIGVGLGGTGWEAEPSRMWTPNPGACGSEAASREYGDGVYEPVLVSQFWSISLQEPLATVVFSAGEIEYTGLGDPEPSPDQDAGELTTDGPDSGIEVIETRDWFEGVDCAALLADEDYVTGAREDRDFVSSLPLPTTLETGRLYGYGADALVGGYPIPVSGEDFDDEYLSGFADLGDARLVVHGDGQTWIFTAAWSERDDLPHDEPGWFVELNQVWDCGSPDLIPEGEYHASLVVPKFEDVYDLGYVAVVSGVPSIPELDEG